MEPQQQYVEQYNYQNQYQNPTPQNNEEVVAPQTHSYDPSSYDHSSSSNYYYSQQTQYYPDYSSSSTAANCYTQPPSHYNSTQTHDLNAITPPGVHLPLADPQQHNYYYPQHPPPTHYLQPSNPVYIGGASQGGQSMRGKGCGTFGRPGRGRGATHGKHAVSQTPGSSAPGKKPACMAWCEVCRVDCNTIEILDKHKNGKKHKRNVKVFEELQNLSKQVTVQNLQIPMSQPIAEIAHSKLPEGSNSNHSSSENVASASGHMESNADKYLATAAEPSITHPSELSLRKDYIGGRGGFKRKMRGGRGGKWMRSHDGSRWPVEPPKPKQVPVLCDLCNVKCESQVVFESHIAGKKHLSNVKRFQGHKEAYGDHIQALYPTIPNLPSTSILTQSGPQAAQAFPSMKSSQKTLQYPQPAQATLTQNNQTSLQDAQAFVSVMPSQQYLQNSQSAQATLTQSNQQGPQDAQTLSSMMLSQQNLRDPEAAQAALTQLLNQHGIHDTQTLIAQLVPYMLAQFQLPGSAPLSAAGLGMDTLNSLSQGQRISTGSEGQNVETVQQNTTSSAGTEAGTGMNEPVDDKPPEVVSS